MFVRNVDLETLQQAGIGQRVNTPELAKCAGRVLKWHLINGVEPDVEIGCTVRVSQTDYETGEIIRGNRFSVTIPLLENQLVEQGTLHRHPVPVPPLEEDVRFLVERPDKVLVVADPIGDFYTLTKPDGFDERAVKAFLRADIFMAQVGVGIGWFNSAVGRIKSGRFNPRDRDKWMKYTTALSGKVGLRFFAGTIRTGEMTRLA